MGSHGSLWPPGGGGWGVGVRDVGRGAGVLAWYPQAGGPHRRRSTDEA